MDENEQVDGFQFIAPQERIELVDKECKHTEAQIVAERPDGLVDCYCPKCFHGGLYNSIDEFRRQ